MKRILLAPLFLLLALFAAAPGFAQLPKLDALLKGLEEKSQFYGSVLVRRGGAKVFQGNYGFYDDSATNKVAPDSVYYLNESSGTFCATLIMMAVDKGLMSLDAPIGTYVPEFKDQPGPRVRDLLSHSSGVGSDFLWVIAKKTNWQCSLGDIAANAAKAGAFFPPGTRFSYTAANVDVLGYALEHATGKPYTGLLSEWILAPLEMKQTGMGAFPGDKAKLPQVVSQKDVEWYLSLTKNGCQPSTNMYATTDDLAVFYEALATGRLVTKASFQLMRTGLFPDDKWTGGKGKMGLGLFVTPSGAIFDQGRYENVVANTFSGHHSLTLWDPRYDLTVVLLANKWRPRPDARALNLVLPAVYADLGLVE